MPICKVIGARSHGCPITSVQLTFCNWIPMWFARQLLPFKWFLSKCFAQVSVLMKSATDVLQRDFPRLFSSSTRLPCFHLWTTRKSYLVAGLGWANLPFPFWFLLYSIEVCRAKWLNSECLNSCFKSKHWSFKGSVRCVQCMFNTSQQWVVRIVTVVSSYRVNKKSS